MQRTKRLQARSPWVNNLNPKRRKPRCGDRVQFQVMPWWGKHGKVYEGTVVGVRYPKSKRRNGYYGNLRLKNGTLELGLAYYVDTFVGGQHLDDAMVLDSEIIRIMKTKPHAHRRKASRRRLKVYQRRKSYKDAGKQFVQEVTEWLFHGIVSSRPAIYEEYSHYQKLGKPFKWGDRVVQHATESEHVMTRRVILDCATGKPVEGMINLGSHVANGTPEGLVYISKVVEGDDIKQIEGVQGE